jgi:cytochrome c556
MALAGGLVVAGVLAAGADRGFAHEGAKRMVNERMNAMKSLKADMKAISDMLRGRVVFKADEVHGGRTGSGRMAATSSGCSQRAAMKRRAKRRRGSGRSGRAFCDGRKT